MTSLAEPEPRGVSGLGFRSFVLLIAALMATNALAIDSMLPVLPEIGRSTGATDEKDWPLVISAFLGGFGIAQLFVGVLADRYGSRRARCLDEH